MKCCLGCFESHYLKQIILRNNIRGNCDFCGSTNIYIYNTEELSIFFQSLLDLYVVDNDNGDNIDIQLIKDFPNKIFTPELIEKGVANDLLKSIMEEQLTSYTELFSSKVSLKFHKEDYGREIVEPLVLSWENFSKEIKSINRFHFENTLDLKKYKQVFSYYAKPISKGKYFYRSRICPSTVGYPVNKMGNPPNDKACDGRVNPRGISYLYVSNDKKTSLMEVRASLYDYITVGKFKLKDEISVINLSENTIDIFTFIDNGLLEEQIIHQPFINKLEEELAKPHRKSDSDLDYLPTQYISELIKSMGVEGIEFKSAQNPDGYNLAIFKPDKFECVSVEVVEITNLDLSFDPISQ